QGAPDLAACQRTCPGNRRAAPPQLIAPQVDGDAEQPDTGRAHVAQPTALPPGSQERLLREVLGGVGVVAQTECAAVDARHPLFQEVAHRTTAPTTPPSPRRVPWIDERTRQRSKGHPIKPHFPDAPRRPA